MSDEQATKAVQHYRERYAEEGMLEADIYPGMEKLLQNLGDAGVTCAVASVKMETIVRKTLAHFRPTDYFDAICGAPPDINIKRARKLIVKRSRIADQFQYGRLPFGGDSGYDARGAGCRN